MDKIARPVETASSSTSPKSELFAKKFVFRVLVNKHRAQIFQMVDVKLCYIFFASKGLNGTLGNLL